MSNNIFPDGEKIHVEICGKLIEVEICSTPNSQFKGYRNVNEEPKEGEGKLFVFDKEKILSFWMKGVTFDLDIIFFDSKLNYVNHHTMKKLIGENSRNTPTYLSKKPAMFAVETKSEWCNQNGVDYSCKLKFIFNN